MDLLALASRLDMAKSLPLMEIVRKEGIAGDTGCVGRGRNSRVGTRSGTARVTLFDWSGESRLKYLELDL